MLSLVALSLATAALSPAQALPRCRPGDLTVSVDGKDGDFNGMSHGGTLLVLHNRSRRGCTVDGVPMVTMLDAHGRRLPIERSVPRFMHPGPVIVPVALPAGGSASTALRWVSGPVYDQNSCFDVARATVRVNGATRSVAITAHICGPAGGKVTFEQPPLKLGTAG